MLNFKFNSNAEYIRKTVKFDDYIKQLKQSANGIKNCRTFLDPSNIFTRLVSVNIQKKIFYAILE